MLFAIVIASTGATLGVLMTLFSFANCLGDIVLCIIPFFLRKKYPHACRHAGFTMPLWVLYAMSVFAIVVAAYLSYSALLTLGEQLGKYDAQLQRTALDACIETLQADAAQMQADTVRRGKLFCGLGATLGLLAAVALF